jgi:hypothetical protein
MSLPDKSLRFDVSGCERSSYLFTDRELSFPPEFILSDLQQVLWPYLPDHNEWQVIEDPRARGRRVFFHKQLVTAIRYHGDSLTNGYVELTNIPWNYQLRIHIHSTLDKDRPAN